MTRAAHYEGMSYETDYPKPEDFITKQCEVCGYDMVVNNWPDKKTRTPKFKGLIVCPNCDPRHPEDRYKKEGYRILHPLRLRIINLARVTRGLSFHGCLKPATPGPCKCAGCAAMKLFPPF